ncbi:MAG: hypothetical protein IKZ47_07710 [Clostridia bacterium]|nr:hypothetical protein [Clostridia bacterium]
MPSGEIVRCAHGEMKSTHARRHFTRVGVFHLRSRFHPPDRVDFVEKSTCVCKCFFW